MTTHDDRPDPRTWSSSQLAGLTDAETIAVLDALHARMADEAAAARGGAPLGPISRVKADFPIIVSSTRRLLPDGTIESFDPPLEPPTWDAEKIWDYDGHGNLLPEDQRPSLHGVRDRARDSARNADSPAPATPDEDDDEDHA